MEIDQCQDKMHEHEEDDNRKCILHHTDFNDVCLKKWILEIASIELKTIKDIGIILYFEKVKRQERSKA